MMHLMKLVEIRQMEQLMPPKSKAIFVVDNHDYLNEHLGEIWEIMKAKFCSFNHWNAECYRKYYKLIKD